MNIRLCKTLVSILSVTAVVIVQGCGKNDFLGKKATPLMIEDVDPGTIGPVAAPQPVDPQNHDSDEKDPCNSGKITLKPAGGLHPIFSAPLGISIPRYAMGVVDADPTGVRVENDWDGDGVENDLEVMSGSMVADYPRVVTRITTPIVMELRKSETATGENYTEVIDNSDTKQTIANSMENRHYAQMNTKTTPYVTKESQSTDNGDAFSYGDSHSTETDLSVNIGLPVISPMGGAAAANSSTSTSTKSSNSQNYSISSKFAQSTMSEKTVFQDVDYADNLDRNGIEFRDEKIQTMTTNFRKSEKTKETYEVGPNAGFVRAGLYIKNDTVNMPVRISNVICTLSFRTAGGAILPVKTFRLRNDDYSEFDQEIYGDEELGPYTIEVSGLNTFEVKQALANGYMPQITVVNYDMTRVDDSNYNPGADNLKIVEETAKARTALIKIVGANTREIYRVAAFDVAGDGTVTPGISLKKALFNIYGDSIGRGETWEADTNGNILTVQNTGLKWKEGFIPEADNQKEYAYSSNKKGNQWRLFETYVKSYVDEYNQTRRIETIRRIGPLRAYNPFDVMDNSTYNPNEYLEREELMKMKYWIILHNGRYFEGDINDPIWAGERYEIICMDIRDYNEYFKACSFTPVQSREYFTMGTSWNRLTNEGEFARSRYLGRIVKNDVVHLELNLTDSRFLFANNSRFLQGGGVNNHYTLESDAKAAEGIPAQFSHYAEGGFNNIKVTINESKNAQRYEIKFRRNANEAQWRKIVLGAEELARNNGEVFIHSRTVDSDGRGIGLVQGSLLSQGGLEYVVNVTALGTINGVPVYTASMNNKKEEAFAHVYAVEYQSDSQNCTAPGGRHGFTFSAAGLADNWIYVRVADAEYTEYFIIKVKGPYNYSHNGYEPPLKEDTVPVKDFIGHRGLNRIQMTNPPGEIGEPGVYKVEVYALNNNSDACGLGPRMAENELQFVTLAHDRYAAQRIYKPAVSEKLFDVNAIDLEVNFNNGDGWCRLKLEGNDRAAADVYGEKTIDCRFHSYVDYDTQRFHIFFKAPTGTNDEYSKQFANSHNAFFGGRETVDLYIRTPADMVYRDTFWSKAQPAFLPDNSMAPVLDWLNLVVDNDTTDASNIEETLKHNLTAAVGFNGANLDDYFFSPVEYRKFDIRASLAEKLPDMQANAVDLPRYTVAGSCGMIQLSNINSRFADSYEIYYRMVNPGVQGAPYITFGESPLSWDRISLEPSQSIPGQLFRQVIPDLAVGQRYLVAVIGYNKYGRSEPSYWDGAGNIEVKTGDDATLVRPVRVPDCTAPGAPTFDLGENPGNNRRIGIHNIQCEGAHHYLIEWKVTDPAVTIWESHDTAADANPLPLVYATQQLLPWRTYLVRMRGVNRDGYGGVDSETKEFVTGTDFSFGSPSLEWSALFQRGTRWYADLSLVNINNPEGVVRYTVSGTVIRTESDLNGNQIANEARLPVSFNSLLVADDLWVGDYVGAFAQWKTVHISGTVNITFYSSEGLIHRITDVPVEGGSPELPW
ncbi:MAG: hypothetical protein KA369_07190 [Spirochaetes bacterium]|nr:hypothetical protein [Spirochaetota bacterium]